MKQKLSIKEFEAMQLSGNWVLTKPLQEMDKVYGPSGTEFHINPYFDVGRHVPKKQRIVKVSASSSLTPEQEVICRYLAVWNAMGIGSKKEHVLDPRIIICEDTEYLLIRETEIHAITSPQFQMLNDVFLVEKVEEKDSELHTITFEDQQKKAKPVYGKVVAAPEGYEALVDTVVVFGTWDIVEFEYKWRQTVGAPGTQLYRLHLSDIMATKGKVHSQFMAI